MDIDVFRKPEQDTVFRVLRTALNPGHALEDRERLFLETYARITGYALERADPPALEAAAAHVSGAHPRKRLVQLAALAVLVTHPVRPASVDYLEALARRLDVRDTVVDVVRALQQGRHFKVRVLAMRRAMRSMFKDAYRSHGLRGLLRFAGAMFLKISAGSEQTWAFKRLGLLPEGTLGRAYWTHMVGNGFGFPGEPGGIPDPVAYHDVAHVLAGNDTTPLGEIQQGSFQAGNRREDGFFFAQFVVLQFHQGIKVTPATGGHYGNYRPDLVLWAIHRGATCDVDLTHRWDFWPLMDLPLAEARRRIGLLPKLQAALKEAA
jgi:hypothetical protein